MTTATAAPRDLEQIRNTKKIISFAILVFTVVLYAFTVQFASVFINVYDI